MKKILCALAVLLSIALLPWFAISDASGDTPIAQRISMTVTVPKDRESEAFLLTDGYASTYMQFRRESTVRADFSEPVSTLVTVWESEPSQVILHCYAGEESLSEMPLEVPYLSTVTALPEGTTSVELVLAKRGEAHLSELYAYGAGALPETEYQWEPAASPDVLLVVAYPGDEYRFFGGLLPKLVNDGASVAVCYCCDYSRERLEEGMRALWTLGIRSYPVLLHVECRRNLAYQPLERAWKKGRADKLLANTLQALQPQIVIAPSDAESGAAEQRVAAEFAKLVCAANPQTFQKLYLASDGEDATHLKNENLPLYENRDADSIARELLLTLRSVQFMEYSIDDSYAFRLVQTHVENDERRDSLFEHLSVKLHPSVTATPVPTDTPEPTEEPTDTSEPTEAPTPTAVMTTPVPTDTPTPKHGLFSCAGKEETPVPTAVPTEVPTPEPTEEPTPEAVVVATPAPTEEPTPTPEPTEEPQPEHFLNPGEPEEVTEDRENGYWSFRDDSTHIEIRRVKTTDEEEQVQVYFIAHVWMNRNMHRSGFGDEGRTGRTSQKAYRIARRYGAVLLITGDNIINMDVDKKGPLIRDGIVYNRFRYESAMAWNEQALTFDLFDKGITVEELQERGYREVYSFGPILMRNGELSENLNTHRIGTNNPRTGVGMVEPGHFVLIVADGRQADYAIGLRMEAFAQLFKDEGCVSAYNLDGGVSAAMVFMGEHLNQHLNIKDWSKQRNLPDGLLFGHTDSLPDEMDPPPEHDGIRTDADDQLIIIR